MKFPLDEESRDRIRAETMDYYILKAVRSATDHMRSLRCQRGDHKCRNTGESCLCLCHDRKRSIWEVEDVSDSGPCEDQRDDPHGSLDADREKAG